MGRDRRGTCAPLRLFDHFEGKDAALAKALLAEAPASQNQQYDAKVQLREFALGHQVLLLLPTSENKLQVAGTLCSTEKGGRSGL